MANKRNITYFIISQSVSLLGSMLVMYAIMWHITLTTKSGFMMTIYVLTTFLPALFISFFAGVWADRLNKKKVMITADLTITTFTLLIAVWMLVKLIKIPKKDNFEEDTKIAYFKEMKEGIQYAYKK